MAQKGIIDPNLEITLKKFAKSKGTAASSRVENKGISWFRPVMGKLLQVKRTPGQPPASLPPSAEFEVKISNKEAGTRALATVKTDPHGSIISITVDPYAQGNGFILDDECTITPTDPLIAKEYPLDQISVVAGETSWEGGLLTAEDLIKIHTAFQTDEAEKKLIEAYTVNDPGNSSDGIVLPLQIDYLAQAERACRARATQNFPRMLTHLAAREKGHGQPTGVFLGQALDYFILLLKQGASASGGPV